MSTPFRTVISVGGTVFGSISTMTRASTIVPSHELPTPVDYVPTQSTEFKVTVDWLSAGPYLEGLLQEVLSHQPRSTVMELYAAMGLTTEGLTEEFLNSDWWIVNQSTEYVMDDDGDKEP